MEENKREIEKAVAGKLRKRTAVEIYNIICKEKWIFDALKNVTFDITLRTWLLKHFKIELEEFKQISEELEKELEGSK